MLDSVRQYSFDILSLHARIYGTLAESILARLEGDEDRADELRICSANIAFENEDLLAPVLDTFFYDIMTKRQINLFGEISFADN